MDAQKGGEWALEKSSDGGSDHKSAYCRCSFYLPPNREKEADSKDSVDTALKGKKPSIKALLSCHQFVPYSVTDA